MSSPVIFSFSIAFPYITNVSYCGPWLPGTYHTLAVAANKKVFAPPGTAARVLAIEPTIVPLQSFTPHRVGFIGDPIDATGPPQLASTNRPKYVAAAVLGNSVIAMPCYTTRILEINAVTNEVKLVGPYRLGGTVDGCGVCVHASAANRAAHAR